jgi:hypothetical protein
MVWRIAREGNAGSSSSLLSVAGERARARLVLSLRCFGGEAEKPASSLVRLLEEGTAVMAAMVAGFIDVVDAERMLIGCSHGGLGACWKSYLLMRM